MPNKIRQHMAFELPEDLQLRAEAVIAKVRADSTPRAHSDELVELIVELTDTGLHSYFMAPLERIAVGAMAMATARVSLAAAGKSLPALVRRVVGKMNDDQLREVVEIMDEMLV